jgi:hypothetical protein
MCIRCARAAAGASRAGDGYDVFMGLRYVDVKSPDAASSEDAVRE